MASEVKSDVSSPIESIELNDQILPILDQLDMTIEDLNHFRDLSPYLILDGHRTGIKDSDVNPARGYVEGAEFSLRFAKVLQKLGGEKATFLIHTLRNYQTMDRMKSIFSAIEDVGKKFISTAHQSNVKLKYFGESVHEKYAMSGLVNKAEKVTKDCNGFDLNYLTNYSEDWGVDHKEELEEVPDISVIGRFTKGHFSGAGIPGHSSKANFMYIQQASVSENWSDKDLLVLALSLLKSHIALNGYVGGKSYKKGEKDEIREAREEEMWDEDYCISEKVSKKIISFSPKGPITIKF